MDSRWVGRTLTAHRLQVFFQRLLQAPNQLWCGDITYIATDEGWLDLAVVIDLHSWQAVVWNYCFQ